MNLIAYSDGKRNIFEISNLLQKSLSEVNNEEYKKLKEKKF